MYLYFKASGTCRDDYCEVVVIDNYGHSCAVALRATAFGGFPERAFARLERNEKTMRDTPENRAFLVAFAQGLVASVERDYGLSFAHHDYKATRRRFWAVATRGRVI